MLTCIYESMHLAAMKNLLVLACIFESLHLAAIKNLLVLTCRYESIYDGHICNNTTFRGCVTERLSWAHRICNAAPCLQLRLNRHPCLPVQPYPWDNTHRPLSACFQLARLTCVGRRPLEHIDLISIQYLSISPNVFFTFFLFQCFSRVIRKQLS